LAKWEGVHLKRFIVFLLFLFLGGLLSAQDITDLQAHTAMIEKFGIAGFIVIVAVVAGFFYFVKVIVPKHEIALKESTAGEIVTFKQLIEEVKAISENTDRRITHIENVLGSNTENIEKLFSVISVHEQLSNKISEGTLTNQLFSDELWPFLRLKAFRRLLAKRKNGRIWEKGYTLVLDHKEDWLNVLDTDLGIPIVDEEYYYARLGKIQKRIFDGFSRK
jgi:hypothetical protein